MQKFISTALRTLNLKVILNHGFFTVPFCAGTFLPVFETLNKQYERRQCSFTTGAQLAIYLIQGLLIVREVGYINLRALLTQRFIILIVLKFIHSAIEVFLFEYYFAQKNSQFARSTEIAYLCYPFHLTIISGWFTFCSGRPQFNNLKGPILLVGLSLIYFIKQLKRESKKNFSKAYLFFITSFAFADDLLDIWFSNWNIENNCEFITWAYCLYTVGVEYLHFGLFNFYKKIIKAFFNKKSNVDTEKNKQKEIKIEKVETFINVKIKPAKVKVNQGLLYIASAATCVYLQQKVLSDNFSLVQSYMAFTFFCLALRVLRKIMQKVTSNIEKNLKLIKAPVKGSQV